MMINYLRLRGFRTAALFLIAVLLLQPAAYSDEISKFQGGMDKPPTDYQKSTSPTNSTLRYADEILGSSNLVGAKFLGKIIWEDQVVNSRPKTIGFRRAWDYCEQLDLLGLKAWELPKQEDFEHLGNELDAFSYLAINQGTMAYYFTQTRCEALKIPRGSCILGVDIGTNHKPYVEEISWKTSVESVRCVLNPHVYNASRLAMAEQAATERSVDGYLRAFSAAGNREDIEKAIKLARSTDDNKNIEKTLVEFTSYYNTFETNSEAPIFSKQVNSNEINTKLVNSIQKSKNLKSAITIRKKIGGLVPLKYNEYRVQIRFNLKLTYRNVLKKALMGIDMASSETTEVPIETTYVLSPANNFIQTKTIDFGSVNQGGSSNVALIFKTDTELTSASITHEILSVSIH